MDKNEHLILDCIPTDKGYEIVPHEGYEIKQEGDKYYLVKKELQYPKTYKECCEVLGMQSNLFLSLSSMDIDGEVDEKSYGYKIARQMNYLYDLLVCRDAYWKIAGEKMGLGKPLEPHFGVQDSGVYVINNETGNLIKVTLRQLLYNRILAFPTEEMRDVFYKNFKDLIEMCKELL